INFFFSSEGHNSMGGYDLFYSTLKAGTWKGAVNLGFPVNTPSNERYYVLTADGGTAYYSSDMKGGHGQQDIYTISPGFLGEPPVIALVVGFVTKNGNPVDAKINVTDSANGNSYGNYQSNASTGKYLIALRPGNTYKVAIEVEGAENYFEYVNVKSLDTYVEVNKDYNFVIPQGGDTAAYAIPVMTDSSDVLQQKIDAQLRLIREEQNVQVYEQRIYRQVLKKHGEDYDSTIHFAVDLGTYQNPADFDSTKLVGLGIIKREITPQGYYRYSVGPFKTMLDADLYRSRIAARDSTIGSNSEVVVYKNGERQTIPSFYRAEYRRKNYVPREETRVVMSKKGTLATAEGTDISYDNVIEDKGTFQAQGLEYKLEIASVTDTNDFRLSYLSKYGKIEKKTYPDGVTRYYFGPWKTLKEADDFRKDLLAKDSVAAQSLIMVFYFGQRKPVQEFFAASPCNHNPVDLAFFKNKTLNNPAVYKKFLSLTGNYCASGLIYRVQIGAYRHPENFKYPQLAEFGAADIKMYADSITLFTLKEFTTVREAEAFRQECIKRGIKDAWITALYKGERKTLEQLILEDFYGKLIQ
ncbi:MAG TPA: hypothetical protein VI731_05965, partial [Bacteroidia bacterium]|nr:hypothetical protein [Bacteroidia bacterium]